MHPVRAFVRDALRSARQAPHWGIAPQNLRDDLIAGITVALLAIPQSLAYAQLAGMPAYFGLYAALIPCVVGALFGSSWQLSTGPVAMTSLLTAASVAPLAGHGTELYYTYVVALALISGILQIAFGVLRLGILLNFLSHPVLIGFVNAAAIIIGLSQLPAMLGISLQQSNHFLVDIYGVLTHIDTMHGLSLVFGVVTIVMLLAFRRYAPRWPGVLLTVALLTWVSYLCSYAAMGGRVVGEVPRGLPSFAWPEVTLGSTALLLPAAFVIALISFMEAMSSAKVIAIKTRRPWNENRELVGQGLAKVSAAFCQTMPVSGSFSRSALNLASNARTPLASLVSAAFVLITLAFFTSLLFHLPKPVLAAIIMLAVVGLINARAIGNAWRANRDDGIAASATFVATLAFAPNIQIGMMTGIMLSLGLLLYRMMRPSVTPLDLHPDGTLTEKDSGDARVRHPKLGAIRFDGALLFMNVAAFENALLALERDNPRLACILVQASGINSIDASGVEALRNLTAKLRNSGQTLAFSGLKRQVLAVMQRSGLPREIGEENMFASDRAAIATLLARFDSETAVPTDGDASGK